MDTRLAHDEHRQGETEALPQNPCCLRLLLFLDLEMRGIGKFLPINSTTNAGWPKHFSHSLKKLSSPSRDAIFADFKKVHSEGGLFVVL